MKIAAIKLWLLQNISENRKGETRNLEGYLPYPESWPLHFQWCLMAQPQV